MRPPVLAYTRSWDLTDARDFSPFFPLFPLPFFLLMKRSMPGVPFICMHFADFVPSVLGSKTNTRRNYFLVHVLFPLAGMNASEFGPLARGTNSVKASMDTLAPIKPPSWKEARK